MHRKCIAQGPACNRQSVNCWTDSLASAFLVQTTIILPVPQFLYQRSAVSCSLCPLQGLGEDAGKSALRSGRPHQGGSTSWRAWGTSSSWTGPDPINHVMSSPCAGWAARHFEPALGKVKWVESVLGQTPRELYALLSSPSCSSPRLLSSHPRQHTKAPVR